MTIESLVEKYREYYYINKEESFHETTITLCFNITKKLPSEMKEEYDAVISHLHGDSINRSYLYLMNLQENNSKYENIFLQLLVKHGHIESDQIPEFRKLMFKTLAAPHKKKIKKEKIKDGVVRNLGGILSIIFLVALIIAGIVIYFVK